MRLWVLLLLAGCQKAVDAPAPAPVDAAVPVEDAAIVDAAPPVDAGVIDAARALPSKALLLAAARGTSARGFVAMTNGADHAVVAVGGPHDADRPVLVASFTKLWTAIAVLRAVARHDFSLDDDIATLLPDLKSKPWSDSTVRELIAHVSRVPEFDEHAGYYRKRVDLTNPVPVLAANIGAGTEKRGVWKYRNSEFALLGAILQAKEARPAAEVLARDVLEPAGMTHAGLAVGEVPPDLDFASVGSMRPQNFFTAGAGYASANDLLAFFDALGAGKLLDPGSESELFAGQPDRNHAAFGCWAFPYPAPGGGTTLLVERPGSFGNVRLFSAFFPEERRAIVLWSGAAVDVGRPRTKGTLAAALARLGLE